MAGQRYNLKWTTGNESLTSLQRFFNLKTGLEYMLKRVKEMMRVLPDHTSAVIKFALLTGLRPSEAYESVRLIITTSGKIAESSKEPQYYNPEQQTLEHFRFAEIFLRPTKKAFLSHLSTVNYYHAIAKIGSKTPNWNAIRLTCRRRNINMEMRFCRKILASHLRQSEYSLKL